MTSELWYFSKSESHAYQGTSQGLSVRYSFDKNQYFKFLPLTGARHWKPTRPVGSLGTPTCPLPPEYFFNWEACPFRPNEKVAMFVCFIAMAHIPDSRNGKSGMYSAWNEQSKSCFTCLFWNLRSVASRAVQVCWMLGIWINIFISLKVRNEECFCSTSVFRVSTSLQLPGESPCFLSEKRSSFISGDKIVSKKKTRKRWQELNCSYDPTWPHSTPADNFVLQVTLMYL